MHITAKFYGNLKRYMPEKKETARIVVAPETTIVQLLAEFGVPDSNVWMSAVNDVVVDQTTALHDGDVLEVFEPVGGGAGSWMLKVRGWRLEAEC